MINDYKIIRKLGSGGFGTTFLASKDEKLYVIKEINLLKSNEKKVMAEVNVLKKIAKYSCIDSLLCFTDFKKDDKNIYIVTTAFKESTTLTNFIQAHVHNKTYINRKTLLF